MKKIKRGIIVGLFIILVLLFYFFKNTSFLIRAGSFIAALIGFYFIDYSFNIEFRISHYICFIIILITGFLLSPLFFINENYDKLLHFLMPIFGSIIIFFLVNKLKIDFRWKILITFCSIIAFLAIQEIAEYILDYFWDLKLQGVYLRDATGLEKYKILMDKNDDTMIDLILGLAGSLVYYLGKTIRHFARQGKKIFKK